MKLADFGLAIEVEGDQQAWFGKDLTDTNNAVLLLDFIIFYLILLYFVVSSCVCLQALRGPLVTSLQRF